MTFPNTGMQDCDDNVWVNFSLPESQSTGYFLFEDQVVEGGALTSMKLFQNGIEVNDWGLEPLPETSGDVVKILQDTLLHWKFAGYGNCVENFDFKTTEASISSGIPTLAREGLLKPV